MFVDGPNADNQACAWGAMHAFSDSVKLAGIVISATAVNYDADAAMGSRNIEQSRAAHHMHAKRMAGLFRRAGVDVPVYLGLDIEDADITTPIPHSAHVRHSEYDIFGDGDVDGRGDIHGDLSQLIRDIEASNVIVHAVVGGPFSEVALLLDYVNVRSKLGTLAAQAGFTMSERAIYSKMAFNAEVDLEAFAKVFIDYPQATYNVPSDITRHPSVTFSGADELEAMGAHPELVEIFRQHRARAAARHATEQLRSKGLKPYPPLSIHDLQAVMALQQVLGMNQGLFAFSTVDPQVAVSKMLEVSAYHHQRHGLPLTLTPDKMQSLGYRGGDQNIRGEMPPRFQVSSQNPELYKQRIGRLLVSPISR